jgi:hypothetical protein
MSKTILSLTVDGLLLALGLPAEAQQPKKIPRIGFVSTSGDPKIPAPNVEAFGQGLHDLGYVEGKNISG